jgi:hypothetical protein
MYPAVSSALLMKSQIRARHRPAGCAGAATPSACPDAVIDSRVISPYPPPQLNDEVAFL